jgi:hypothetical protein
MCASMHAYIHIHTRARAHTHTHTHTYIESITIPNLFYTEVETYVHMMYVCMYAEIIYEPSHEQLLKILIPINSIQII